MMEAVRVLQTAPVNTMVVATGLRSSVPAVKKAVNTALIPWNPVPAITCSLRSTVGAPTTISQVLRSTVTVVGPGLRSTVVTSGRSLRSTTKTVGQVPENTVDTAGMDHRSTVISIARDLWNAVVTARMGLRSTVITVARSLRNVVITDDQGPGNGTAAGIIAGNQGTIMTPTDLLDAGTGVDLQATRTEAAIDIRQPHTATMKILLGVTPVTGAIGLRNAVTPVFDVGLIVEALHHNTVGHGAHAKPQASWRLQVPHRGTRLQSQPIQSPQSSPQGRGSPPTCNLGVHLGTAVSWSTGTGGDFVYAGCFSQAAVHTQFQTRLLPSEL